MGIFENYILFQEAPNNAQPNPQQQQQVQPPPEPPDPTVNQQQQDPNAQAGADPNTQQDPNAQGDPNAQAGADPNAQGDPNADPNAQQDPNAQGDPNADPNAQQDPNAQGDPNAQAGADPNAQQDPNAQGDPNAQAGADPNAQQPQAPPSITAEIDQKEQETFSDLKPEQIDIMIIELKKNYKTLHFNIEQALEKINKISHTTYDDALLDMLVRKLALLKNIIRDSVNDAFPTRSYVENKIELKRYTNIYNNISRLLSEIYQSRLKRQQQVQMDIAKQNKFSRKTDFPLFSRGFDDQ